jgi:hypothetical protein
VSRAYVYRPNLSAEQAREQALGQVVEKFFGGSREAALAQLGAASAAPGALHMANAPVPATDSTETAEEF